MATDQWQDPLLRALASNDPEIMKEALKYAPAATVQMTIQAVTDQGHAHYQRQQYKEALQYYNMVLSLETSDFYVLVRRAECLLNVNELEEAQSAAAHCCQQRPDHFGANQLLGQACLARKDKAGALAAFRKASELKPKDKQVADQVTALEKEQKKNEELLQRVLDPSSVEEPTEDAPPPVKLSELTFDPALLCQTDVVPDPDNPMYQGIRSFLQRYADLEAPRQLLARLEDRAWLQPWLDLMTQRAGSSVLFWGSQGGILPLVAHEKGASRLLCWDTDPAIRRLAQGTIQKNLALRLHARQAEGWADLTAEQRQEQFEKATSPFDFLNDPEGDDAPKPCAEMVFTDLDHSLLGRGIVSAIRTAREKLLAEDALIFPARAQIFAVGIEWNYQQHGLDFSELDPFLWSPYPQRVRLGDASWRPLTEIRQVTELDLVQFQASHQTCNFKVETDGTLHGIIFWYQLDLAGQTLSNGPEGPWHEMGQAFQYVDAGPVTAGSQLSCEIQVSEERLFFQTQPAIARPRTKSISRLWAPSNADQSWASEYLQAQAAAIEAHRPKSVLNIGAGNGYLAMAAARSGATVFACELSENLCQALESGARRNQLQDRLKVLHQDVRKLEVPEHLPEKVDMVVFDAFDCGLLGNGILYYLQHTLANLAAEGATLMPRHATIEAVLIERRPEQLTDFDVSLLTPYLFSTDYLPVDLSRVHHRVLSQPFTLFSFDFSKASPEEEEREITIPLTQSGVVGAVVFYYKIQLDEKTTLSTGPGENGGREQAIQFLPEVQVASGETLTLKVKSTGSNLNFAIKPDGIEEDKIVTLPRFDPRWLQAKQNLMQQEQSLMQQLFNNPEEYAKAGELATCLATYPVRFGVDPEFADRFFRTFTVK